MSEASAVVRESSAQEQSPIWTKIYLCEFGGFKAEFATMEGVGRWSRRLVERYPGLAVERVNAWPVRRMVAP